LKLNKDLDKLKDHWIWKGKTTLWCWNYRKK